MWRSPVAHLLWEQGVAGSNPVTPTKSSAGWGLLAWHAVGQAPTAHEEFFMEQGGRPVTPTKVSAGYPASLRVGMKNMELKIYERSNSGEWSNFVEDSALIIQLL